MKNSLVIRFIVSTLSVFFAAWILEPKVELHSFTSAMLVALVLALLNLFVKPLLILFTLPATIFSFGLFLFVINAAVIWLAAEMVSGFTVQSFAWALIFSLLLSFISSLLFRLGGREEPRRGA